MTTLGAIGKGASNIDLAIGVPLGLDGIASRFVRRSGRLGQKLYLSNLFRRGVEMTSNASVTAFDGVP